MAEAAPSLSAAAQTPVAQPKTAPQRPTLAQVPARPDHVIRSMTRDEAARIIAARQK